jgi:hypothetical protein
MERKDYSSNKNKNSQKDKHGHESDGSDGGDNSTSKHYAPKRRKTKISRIEEMSLQQQITSHLGKLAFNHGKSEITENYASAPNTFLEYHNQEKPSTISPYYQT